MTVESSRCPWCDMPLVVPDECECGWERGDPSILAIERRVVAGHLERPCHECSQTPTILKSESYRDVMWRKDKSAITLHGIDVYVCGCGGSPIYPAAGPLCDLIKANPEATDFHWNDVTRRWTVPPAPSPSAR